MTSDRSSTAERRELLPCPFCGATDGQLVQAFTRATEAFAYWSVECLSCGVEVADDESQEAADRHWNTRTLSQADGQREVERLRAELKKARESLVPDMFWDADDPERPWDHPLEWLEDVWPVGRKPIINRFQQAMRGPDVWELFVPGKDEDDDWTSQSFASREDAEAALAALTEVHQEKNDD